MLRSVQHNVLSLLYSQQIFDEWMHKWIMWYLLDMGYIFTLLLELCTFFHPFNKWTSYLNWVSYRWHRIGTWFFNLFWQFLFLHQYVQIIYINVIIGMFGFRLIVFQILMFFPNLPIAIYLSESLNSFFMHSVQVS